MSGHRRGGLGFGGAVGLGVAISLLVAVIAIGRAVAAQVEGAVRVVIVFATIALCTVLGAVTLGVLGLLAYHGQRARYHLTEQRLALEQLARPAPTMRAEVLERSEAEGEALEGTLPQATRPAIQGKRPMSATGRHLEAVPEPTDSGGAS